MQQNRSECADFLDEDSAPPERARRGEDAAVEAVVREHTRWLYRIARSLVAHEPALEAVVKTLCRGFSEAPPGCSDFRRRLGRTLIAYVMDRRRELCTRKAGASGRGSEGAPGEEDTVGIHPACQLEAGIHALPAVFRPVVVLRLIERQSGVETAALLDIHETTCRTRLYRANRLCETLQEWALVEGEQAFALSQEDQRRVLELVVRRLDRSSRSPAPRAAGRLEDQ